MMSSFDSMLAYVVSGGAADPSADEELEIKEEEELTDDVFILGQHYSHENHFKEIGWSVPPCGAATGCGMPFRCCVIPRGDTDGVHVCVCVCVCVRMRVCAC